MTVTAEQIAGAADALALQKLQTQIQLEQASAYLAELEAVAAERAAVAEERVAVAAERAALAAYRAAESEANAAARAESKRHNAALEAIFTKNAEIAAANLALFRQQATGFDASERGEVMRKAFDALLPQAVKPSTATTEAGKRTDAKADAEWLRIEVEEVMAAYDALRGTAGA